MKVAVLGSGNGGLACAYELVQRGREVSLFDVPEFDTQIAAVRKAGGITAAGALEGFSPIAYSGHDIAAAMQGADLVLIVGPAFATPPMAHACREYLRPGMTVLVCPASCAGALTFIKEAGLRPEDGVLVGETSTLPYAVRISAPGTIRIFHRLIDGIFVAATPPAGTDRLVSMIEDVWPIQRAENVLQTTLQNGNPVIHPAVSLLNAGAIDRGEEFLFYEEGVTKGVGHLIEAVDRERLAIAGRLGLQVLSEPALGVRQGYMEQENYSTGYSSAPGFLGIDAQRQLDHRYLTEDVGYGLVFLTDVAQRIGVATPVMDSVLTIASVVLARDFRGEKARTLDSLGIGDLSPEDLLKL